MLIRETVSKYLKIIKEISKEAGKDDLIILYKLTLFNE